MPATLSSTYGRLGAVLVQYRLFRQIYQRPVGEHLNLTFVSFDWSNDTPYSDVQASAATTCGYHRSLRLFVAYNNKLVVAQVLVPGIFDYYTKLDFSPAHKIHKNGATFG